MVEIRWDILRPVDIGGQFNNGFAQGRAVVKEAQVENALRAYAQNPNDPNAVNALIGADPMLGMRVQHQQAETLRAQQKQQAEAQAQERKIYGNLAKVADNPEAWDATIGVLEEMGVPNAAQYRGKFSPETRRALMVAGGIEDDGDKKTAMQQNYEWLKTVNPGIADQYIQRQVSEPPMIASNGDGTFTVIPRSQMGGAPAAGGPAPGTVEDGYRFKGGNPADPSSWEPVQGGPTPQASGTFQP